MLDRTANHSAHGFSVLAWPAPAAAQINPYISLVYSQFEQAGIEVKPFRPMQLGRQTADVFHAHWPEAILWGRLAHTLPLLAKVAADHVIKAMDEVRDNGGRVAWTVHNLVPHAVHPTHQAIWDGFFPAFRQRVDLMIGMTERSLDLACDAYPDLASRSRVVIPHPHFRTAYPPPPKMTTAREKLGLPEDSFVVGMLGSVRASKGVPQAISAFCDAQIVNTMLDTMEMLLVAGDCVSESESRKIEQAIGDNTGVIYRKAPLSPADLVESFAAVDAILINQQTTLNSGTLLLALSMNRPVIAPAGGSIGELAKEFGRKWIFTFSGELTAQKLRNFMDQIKRTPHPRIAPLEKLDPAKVSRTTIAALSGARALRRPQEPHYAFSGARPDKIRAHGGGGADRRYR